MTMREHQMARGYEMVVSAEDAPGCESQEQAGVRGIALVVVGEREALRRVCTILGPGEVAVAAMSEPPLTLEIAAELCRQLVRAPDVVILFGGRELLARGAAVELLGTLLPQSRILLVSPCEDRELLRRALRAGVRGIICESRLEEMLLLATRALAAGQLCMPGTLAHRIDLSSFSSREREVLDQVVEGLTNAQIARQLFLSESTVKSHLASSFRKLGLCSRAEAAAAWAEVQEEAEPLLPRRDVDVPAPSDASARVPALAR